MTPEIAVLAHPIFTEDGFPVDQCNECGVLILYPGPLCGHCEREEYDREQSERMEDPNSGCWSYSW